MKVKILRLLEYSGELEDILLDERNWGVQGTRTWGRPGHEITIRSTTLTPDFDNIDYFDKNSVKDTL
jgi:hypothetical protein